MTVNDILAFGATRPRYVPEPVPIDPATGLFVVPPRIRWKDTSAIPRVESPVQETTVAIAPVVSTTVAIAPVVPSPSEDTVAYTNMFTSAGGFGSPTIAGTSSGVLTDIINKGIDIGFDYLRGRIQQPTALTPLPPGTLPGPTLTRQPTIEEQIAARMRQIDVVTANTPGFRKKRRSMNVTNTKALRRAMRRVEGFAKVAKRTISFTKKTKMKSRRRR